MMPVMESEKSCRTCQNRRHLSNVCGRTGRFVSLASRSEWTDYLKRWRDAAGKELATAEKMLTLNPDKKTRAVVKKLSNELASIRARPLGDVVGSCPHYKQHNTLLPIRAVRKEEWGDEL